MILYPRTYSRSPRPRVTFVAPFVDYGCEFARIRQFVGPVGIDDIVSGTDDARRRLDEEVRRIRNVVVHLVYLFGVVTSDAVKRRGFTRREQVVVLDANPVTVTPSSSATYSPSITSPSVSALAYLLTMPDGGDRRITIF